MEFSDFFLSLSESHTYTQTHAHTHTHTHTHKHTLDVTFQMCIFSAFAFLNCTVCTKTFYFLTFVPQLMLDSWNHSIFSNIKHRLQGSAMKLVRDERYGDAFDTQLVIGVRESYGKTWRAWCSTCAYQKHVLMTVLLLVVFVTVIYMLRLMSLTEFFFPFSFWLGPYAWVVDSPISPRAMLIFYL